MSRKIGLGDTYFDPDIDGEIDFDFFGGITPAEDGAGAAVKGRPISPSSSKQQLLDNNNHYDTRQFNLNQQNHKQEVRKMEQNHTEKLANGFESAIAKIEREQSRPTNNSKNSVENDNFNNTHPMDTNHSDSRERQLTEEVKNAEEEVKNMKTESLVELVQQGEKEEDNNEPVFSECDSASDLYSLTDEDSFEDEEGDDCLDSDITEVSPLSSANMSPLPESPKRTPEPRLKRHLLRSNHSLSPKPGDVAMAQGSLIGSDKLWGRGKKNGSGASSCSESESGHDTVDLKVLAKAILELEEERKRNGSGDRSRMPMGNYGRPRKNMTFTNDEVRRIDHENKRLLRRIIDSQKPRRRPQTATHHPGPKVASSAINRVKELRKIETENLVLLKRLQAAKPTKELSREFLLGTAHRGASPYMPESKSSSSLATSHASFATGSPSGSTRGRSSRCHSTGSLSSAVASSAASGSTTSSVRYKTTKPAKGVAVAAHSIPSER